MTYECPTGYICHVDIYKAWDAGQYLLFFGGLIGLVIIAMLVIGRVIR